MPNTVCDFDAVVVGAGFSGMYMLKSLRDKLGLTQAGLAELAGVSTQSVVNWESTEGKISFRQQKTADRMQEIRGMGKKEAWAELEG